MREDHERRSERFRHSCCFPGCNTKSDEDNVTFHRVPSEPKQPRSKRKQTKMNYEIKLYRYKEFKKVLGKNLHTQSRICSNHVMQDVNVKINGQQVLIESVLSGAGLKKTEKPTRL